MKHTAKSICSILAISVLLVLLNSFTGCSSQQKNNRETTITGETQNTVNPDICEPQGSIPSDAMITETEPEGQATERRETTITEGTTVSEETTIPEETTTTEESTVPTTTSAPASTKKTAKVTVKVVDAVKKTIKRNKDTYTYRIPKVIISNKSTSAANKKMMTTLSKINSKYNKMTYSYYIGKGIVSILISINKIDMFGADYKVFNLSIKTGKLISDKSVVKAYGTTDKKFFSMVKSTYKKVGGIMQNSSKLISQQCANRNVSRASYKYVHPYISSNGHLSFVGLVYYDGEAGFPRDIRWFPFDAVKKKCLFKFN